MVDLFFHQLNDNHIHLECCTPTELDLCQHDHQASVMCEPVHLVNKHKREQRANGVPTHLMQACPPTELDLCQRDHQASVMCEPVHLVNKEEGHKREQRANGVPPHLMQKHPHHRTDQLSRQGNLASNLWKLLRHRDHDLDHKPPAHRVSSVSLLVKLIVGERHWQILGQSSQRADR
eukprot:273461-Pelagomonas_calceolata.AAC.3